MAKGVMNEKVYKVFTIDKYICNYLAEEIFTDKSNRYYADKANISEYIVRKIKHPLGYRIPISTLKNITDSIDLKISLFIEDIEKKYHKDLKQEFQYFVELDNGKYQKLSNSEVKEFLKND